MKWLLLFMAVCLDTAQAGVLRTPVTTGLFVEEPNKNGGLRVLKFFTGDTTKSIGVLGRRWSADDEGVTFEWRSSRDDSSGGWKVTVQWEGPVDKSFEDCFDMGSTRSKPHQKSQNRSAKNNTHLAKDSIISKGDDIAAVSERYWLTSSGYYYVYPEVPLFTDYDNSLENHMCFIAELKAPYSFRRRTRNILKYDIWYFDDAKEAHQHAVQNYLGKPSGIPDQRMIEHPIWSTSAKYSKDIDKDSLWRFAKGIEDSGFENGQLQIDSLWEICYGSLTVDEKKLPNFKDLVRDIKRLGFRVSLWVHPFINKDCDPWYSEALEKGYLVLNERGSPDTSWWNTDDSAAGYIDFTNPEATEWFATRVRFLIDAYDIDSFNFDAGESSWSPQIPVQNGDAELHPSHIVSSYVRTVAQFGSTIAVRSGMRSQDLPIFTRMTAKDASWDINNGLATLIPALLQMNLNGYTLVSPGAIGGNGEAPSKELFIRWLQANVFMPTLQFSFLPWDYDEETMEISRRYIELHASFENDITSAMEASVRDGTPVNSPVWWVDPNDEEAVTVTDEYLLGPDILVAPVLAPYTTARDIYLPRGKWYESGDPRKPHEGPVWLTNFPAPIDVLPYFVKNIRVDDFPTDNPQTGAAGGSAPSLFLVLVLLVTACVSKGL